MVAPSSPTAESQSVSLMLGEMRGQLRELIHTLNNTSQKLDAVAERVTAAQGVPAELAELKARVTALEAERNRRDGATGIVSTIMKSPAIGWLVGAAVSAWAILTGKVHP